MDISHSEVGRYELNNWGRKHTRKANTNMEGCWISCFRKPISCCIILSLFVAEYPGSSLCTSCPKLPTQRSAADGFSADGDHPAATSSSAALQWSQAGGSPLGFLSTTLQPDTYTVPTLTLVQLLWPQLPHGNLLPNSHTKVTKLLPDAPSVANLSTSPASLAVISALPPKGRTDDTAEAQKNVARQRGPSSDLLTAFC